MFRLVIRVARLAALVGLLTGLSPTLAPSIRAQILEPDVQILYAVHPEAPGGFFGFMASEIGDLNGDGASEFIIGAWLDSTGTSQGGRAYVFSGRDGALVNIVQGDNYNRLGFSVAGVGDIDKDGVPDYAASGPGRTTPPSQNGRLVVVSGKDQSVIYDIVGTLQTYFGYEVNAAGDVNGDTYPDIAVGAPLTSVTATYSGRVFIISGRDGSTIWTRDGDSEFGSLGTATGGIGDVDGDGLAEVAVGASGEVNGHRNSGKAFVLSGQDGAVLRTLRPASTACDFGDFYIHASDDFNGDGVGDIYLADYCDNRLGPASGRGYVFSGASEDKLRIFNAEHAGDGLGAGRPVHDLDGDGVPEFIISAYTSSVGAHDAGVTYLFSGKTGKVLRTITGTEEAVELGFDTLPIGDVNDDGMTDFLLTGIDVAYVIAGDR